MDWRYTISVPADNFIHLYRYDGDNVLVVDPGESEAVADVLRRYKLTLTTILLTHHHLDHTGGVAELKALTGANVIGSDGRRVPAVNQVVYGGETINLADRKLKVISTPGHTKTCVCYYLESAGKEEAPIVWTGDTLFVAGCGRIFEATTESMYESLKKLVQLPDETMVCCGHDYTVENYEFASSLEPDNEVLGNLLEQAKHARKRSRATSTISQEKETNPFLRADSAPIRTALNMPDAKAVDVFAELRHRKDSF
jgi:hydroxyacylglutathione hydrolase